MNYRNFYDDFVVISLNLRVIGGRFNKKESQIEMNYYI